MIQALHTDESASLFVSLCLCVSSGGLAIVACHAPLRPLEKERKKNIHLVATHPVLHRLNPAIFSAVRYFFFGA